ncbi:EF-hand domain-containing protein [bacterium]|nr:EF-hand domain-containing protein [bacterium]
MRSIRRVSCFVLTASLIGVAALPLSAAEKEQKPRDPAKIFSRKDADGDGKLTLDEFKAGMKEPAVAKADQRFKKIDADGNGTVSLKEFSDAMKAGPKKKKK